MGHELWVGDPAEIRARAVQRQKTDSRDAEHLLDLLRTNRFPRIWVPTPAERDAHLHPRAELRRLDCFHCLSQRPTGAGLLRPATLGGSVFAIAPWPLATHRRDSRTCNLTKANRKSGEWDLASGKRKRGRKPRFTGLLCR